jgi:hypothetical protein
MNNEIYYRKKYIKYKTKYIKYKTEQLAGSLQNNNKKRSNSDSSSTSGRSASDRVNGVVNKFVKVVTGVNSTKKHKPDNIQHNISSLSKLNNSPNDNKFQNTPNNLPGKVKNKYPYENIIIDIDNYRKIMMELIGMYNSKKEGEIYKNYNKALTDMKEYNKQYLDTKNIKLNEIYKKEKKNKNKYEENKTNLKMTGYDIFLYNNNLKYLYNIILKYIFPVLTSSRLCKISDFLQDLKNPIEDFLKFKVDTSNTTLVNKIKNIENILAKYFNDNQRELISLLISEIVTFLYNLKNNNGQIEINCDKLEVIEKNEQICEDNRECNVLKKILLNNIEKHINGKKKDGYYIIKKFSEINKHNYNEFYNIKKNEMNLKEYNNEYYDEYMLEKIFYNVLKEINIREMFELFSTTCNMTFSFSQITSYFGQLAMVAAHKSGFINFNYIMQYLHSILPKNDKN